MFKYEVDSFGILLKGCSLSYLPKYSHRFNDCFIVNDFKKEMDNVGGCLMGKNIVHFVNKSPYASLPTKQYKKFKIDDIQVYQVFDLLNISHLRVLTRYKVLRKKIHWLPNRLLKFNKTFGAEFKNKFPNTGILSIIYALEIIHPKELWVFGMDFYKTDYLFRRDYHKTLQPQIDKYKKLGMVDFTANLFSMYPDIKINLVTSYSDFPDVKNVNKIIVD